MRARLSLVVSVILLYGLMVAFAGQKQQQKPATVIVPDGVTVVSGGTQQFTANVKVTWGATCGAITADGLYTAPATLTGTCVVTATPQARNGAVASTVTIVLPPLTISCDPAAVGGLKPGEAYTLSVLSLGRSASASCIK